MFWAMRILINVAKTIAFISAAILCFSGCGKKMETGGVSSESNYPLPNPPVVVDGEPGTRGGKLIISAMGDPKTLPYITANETSSLDIIRFMFWGLLNFDEVSQTVEPGLAEFWTNSPYGK